MDRSTAAARETAHLQSMVAEAEDEKAALTARLFALMERAENLERRCAAKPAPAPPPLASAPVPPAPSPPSPPSPPPPPRAVQRVPPPAADEALAALAIALSSVASSVAAAAGSHATSRAAHA